MPNRRIRRAFYQAGHAAVELLFDHSPAAASIIPSNEDRGVGGQGDGDDPTPERCRHSAVARYAGVEAERRCIGAPSLPAGAENDNKDAKHDLPAAGAEEAELREAAASLVNEHWGLVGLIAGELLEHQVLLNAELELLYAIYKGEACSGDLEWLRYSAPGLQWLRERAVARP